MLIDILGAKCVGIEAVPVTVEVDITHGIGIHLVGLADVAVKESLLRTVTALQSLGFRIPGKKIVINLAPADMRKNGSGYDLPIALGIIAALGEELVVMETVKGGSVWTTAYYAKEYGTKIRVLPQSPMDKSLVNNNLIKDGAEILCFEDFEETD